MIRWYSAVISPPDHRWITKEMVNIERILEQWSREKILEPMKKQENGKASQCN
jgi:hypothetical protein